MKNSPEKLNFINLNRNPIYQAAVEPRASTALQGLINASYRALMNSTFQLESWTNLHGINT